MSDVYLLVAEGGSDIAILKTMSQFLSKKLKKDIEIRELSPAKDATSRKYPRHGWREVESWCLKHSLNAMDNNAMMGAFAKAGLQARQSWRDLVMFSGAKGLIIQMDTDIAHHIRVNGDKFNENTNRRKHCQSAVLSWLGLNAVPDELGLVLPTYSIENWILAAYDEGHRAFDELPKPIDYDSISNLVDFLIKLGGRVYLCPQENKEVFDKSERQYRKYGTLISNRLDQVCLRCSEAKGFVSFMSQ